MISVNDFSGITDSDRFDSALKNLDGDRILLVPPRKADTEPERSYWLLDRAILLPSDITVILQNCMLKLSDRARDNFFRSANCGIGISEVLPLSNISIRGEGYCVLQGADHPRAVGDSSKRLSDPCPKDPEDICRLADWVPEERRSPEKLSFWDQHDHSFGTDAGKPWESQYGDWRGVGILLASVSRFSIENLCIRESHGWAISCEDCSQGRIEKLHFESTMSKEIDGMVMNMENEDGIDLRNGCHDILISDITGYTGDDVIALTALAGDTEYQPAGSIRTCHVMHNDWSRRDPDIHDIIIRNVVGYSKGGVTYTVRLLPYNSHIYNVVIDGVVDSSPADYRAGGVLLLGISDADVGQTESSVDRNFRDGMKNITISNIICDCRRAIQVAGYLSDSVIGNVVNKNPDCPALFVERPEGLRNVLMNNILSASGQLIGYRNK